ncbi:GPI mannosyltransferase 4 [Trichoplax sp. H2]|nr:GPI mannosyltransferase 4 [Trichoplax sp. H2]|eukprot:RDD38306.1 GPI mannosyltransferase 4 [Trichoplax sp. H2]
MESLPNLYYLLAVLRVILTLMPQSGYIHPDEFFQSPEVIAGDIFDYDTTRTWEWNVSCPLRNIITPYFISGLPMILLKFLKDLFSIDLISPYTLLVLPRLFCCALSFLFDYSVWIVCQRLNIKSNDAMAYLLTTASAHPIFIFCRTFSNFVEMIFFSWLLIIYYSTQKTSPSGSYCNRTWLITGITVAVGFFIRPTFLVFAFWPVLSMLYHQSRTVNLQAAINGSIRMAISGLFIALLLIIVDSNYYRSVQGNFAITPLCFILYNINDSNLGTHGIHPRVTHGLVNMFMLFGPLTVALYYQTLRDIISFLANAGNNDQITQARISLSNRWFLKGCVYIPLVILSWIPHHEPRFILPVIFPLLILFGNNFFGSRNRFRNLIIWILFNVLGILVFGFMHQGGIYPCMKYLHDNYKLDNGGTTINPSTNVIFYRTYMPPKFMLAQFRGNKNIEIFDLAGSDYDIMLSTIESLAKDSQNSRKRNLLVTPTTVQVPTRFKLVKRFFPHWSSENPPNLLHLLNQLYDNLFILTNSQTFDAYHDIFNRSSAIFTTLRYELTLSLYEYVV